MGISWLSRADRIIKENDPLTKKEALAFLQENDTEILGQLNAAYQIRYYYYKNEVKLNSLINIKSGLCPENCGYCSQSKDSAAVIPKYKILSKEEIVEGARQADARGSGTYCIVASGRGPAKKELAVVMEAVKEIKATTGLKLCACLGLLEKEQAEALRASGVDRYNHNINTSSRFHENVVTTHTFKDRTDTIHSVKQAGISPCSGIIAGMGETQEDIVEMLFSLREVDADSVPINFLHAIEGTAFEGRDLLSPLQCLQVAALARFILPTKEIRIAGGREEKLRSLQPMALYAANSVFLGDYLTTKGQEWEKDLEFIKDAGFTVETSAYNRSAEMYS